MTVSYLYANFPNHFCLGSISNRLEADEEVPLEGNVYDFSVNYDAVDKSDIKTFTSI